MAHFDVTGSMEKLMTFLEAIKNSKKMITMSHVIITRLAEDECKMSFDVGFVTIKKSL